MSSAVKRKLSGSIDGMAILVKSIPTTVAVPTAPTTALQTTAAGVMTVGAHTVAITYVTPQGETTIGAAGAARTVDSTHNKIDLTLIPLDPYGLAIGRNVYVTKAGTTTPFFKVGTIADNITRAFTIDVADANLVISPPAANTAITGALRAPLAPTTALVVTGTGVCTDGAHTVAVTYVTPEGETCLGALATARTVNSTNKQILVTALPLDLTGQATGRKIYMTKAGTVWPFFLVATISDMTTGMYQINVADADISASPPTVSPQGSTIIHAAVVGTTPGTYDEIWLWAYNGHTANIILTIEFGGGLVPNNACVVTIPFKSGWIPVVPGYILQNGLFVRAFAATGGKITLAGFVNSITD